MTSSAPHFSILMPTFNRASFLGRALHTLIGYTDQPTAMQLTVYLAILAITFALMRLYGAPAKAMAPARS